VSYYIIHIPTYSSSNEIESIVVVFIYLLLTLGRVVEYNRDYVCLMHDLLNGTTLAQEIVVSPDFSVTEILATKNHKLYYTFLHDAFKSQRLLRPTGDQTGSDTN
jgi:hypothetical protein